MQFFFKNICKYKINVLPLHSKSQTQTFKTMSNMKTLSEQINDVVKAQVSVSLKRRALLELGLTPTDVNVLLTAERREINAQARERRAANDIFGTMTFGVEIECFNAPRTSLIDAMSARNLMVDDITCYSNAHNGDSNARYKLVPDGSIEGLSPVECVTPILRGNTGFNSLKNCCNALHEIGAKVNKSTGLHVHVGGDITNTQYVNTFRNYAALESVIDTFMAYSRRANNAFYAKSIKSFYLAGCSTPEQVLHTMGGSRYYKVNPYSWGRHHTIEFRQHQGSTDYKKINMWVRFCVKLVLWSRENLITNAITSVNDIPFLNAAEKRFFSARVEEFNGTTAMAA